MRSNATKSFMSFGELVSVPTAEDDVESGVAPNIANELRGHLRALAANSAALRRWEGTSSAEDATIELRRVRTLRAQSRDLVRDAAALVTRLETAADQVGAAPTLRAEADEFRELMRQHIEDFSDALRESISRERDAISVSTQLSSPSTPTIATLPELGDSRPAPHTNTITEETAPLLQADARELALRRELESTAQLRAQRVSALREIQSSVEDVNGIMTDLASIIGDQATTLEFVAVNIEESAAYSSSARNQLERARRGREKKQKLFFTVLTVVAIVIAVLLVILLS